MRPMMRVIIVGLSPKLKFFSKSTISSIVNVLKVKAAFSSANNSSTDVGMLIRPPKVVRCVESHHTIEPSSESVVVTPSVLHRSLSSSQNLHVISMEQLASM